LKKEWQRYARVSTKAQADKGYSISNQCDEIKRCCEENNISLLKFKEKGKTKYKIFSDEGVSGSAERRPALKKLLEAAEQKNFNLLVFYHTSRLGRDRSRESVKIKRKGRKNHIKMPLKIITWLKTHLAPGVFVVPIATCQSKH
jgi:DNA invertase Pin-like site-specific DNA recombinase